jgi:membrane protein DedA with SNARE-associated domain
METALWSAFFVGNAIGYHIGRWRAENRRARHDQTRVWNERHDYRGNQG